ncbi:hypothetical protein [Streptomyces eurythermus]|uniref:hypothetical protein n=1 Tax=Streptomyces eurythermus TaxID=42237 RepID=UPI0033E762B1
MSSSGGGCGGDEEKPAAEAKAPASAAPAKPVPPYKITLQKLVRDVPHIDVEVDSKENLRGVFEEVANDWVEKCRPRVAVVPRRIQWGRGPFGLWEEGQLATRSAGRSAYGGGV